MSFHLKAAPSGARLMVEIEPQQREKIEIILKHRRATVNRESELSLNRRELEITKD